MPQIPAHFDFYITTMADWPASFFVDLGLAVHAPMKQLPQRLHVVANLKRPRADGMRERSEADELHAMEDEVTVVIEGLGGRYVGRVTWQGRSDAVFYVPGNLKELAVIEAATGDYDVSLRIEEDPSWSFYLQFLLPNPFQHRTMQNRHVLEALEEHGDASESPREIDHVFICRTPTPLERLAGALEKRGFRNDEIVRNKDGLFMLQAHRADAPAHPRMDEVSAEIFEVLPDTVTYDGWGCGIVGTA